MAITSLGLTNETVDTLTVALNRQGRITVNILGIAANCQKCQDRQTRNCLQLAEPPIKIGDTNAANNDSD